MQAMSMIDMSAHSYEALAPAKSPEPQGKEFGKVLNEQRQPERTQQKQQQPVQKQEAKGETQPTSTETQAAEQPQQEQKLTAQAEPAAQNSPVRTKPQQTLINLIKVIAGGETPELVEEFGSTEELLTQLVQQLEGSELKGEQVLAGIDLSGLVAQLEALTAEGGEEQLQQLVAQIEEQLVTQEALLANSGLVAMQPNGEPQVAVQNLAQARQILQNALDSTAKQQAPEMQVEQAVVAEGEGEAQEPLFGEKPAEAIDPRFAGLLKPRSESRLQEQPSLRQQLQGQAAKPAEGQLNTQLMAEATPEQSEGLDFAELLATNPKQALENLAQQSQGQVQPVAAQTQQAAARVMPNTPMVQLPSGQQVAEGQIFDQVVARFSGGFNGESGKMVLRMQPAELGSLKIELMVEGDRIRASLQAQSLQVQEVLERNLPQLRNALAEQGLKIDQFSVDVNRDPSQQFEQMAQHQQQQRQGSSARPGWSIPREADEQIIPLAHLMQNGGGGISLHV